MRKITMDKQVAIICIIVAVMISLGVFLLIRYGGEKEQTTVEKNEITTERLTETESQSEADSDLSSGTESETVETVSSSESDLEETIDTSHDHDFSVEVIEEDYLKEKATCSSLAVYYYTCSCGEKGIDADTFEHGAVDMKNHVGAVVIKCEFMNNVQHKTINLCSSCDSVLAQKTSGHNVGEGEMCIDCGGSTHIHRYTSKNTEDQYLISEGTCTKKAKYYYSCYCGEKDGSSFDAEIDKDNHVGDTKNIYSCKDNSVHIVEMVCKSCKSVLTSDTAEHNYGLTHTCSDCGYTIPGLYETGSKYNKLLMSWDELIQKGIISEDGKIRYSKERYLAGDLAISASLTDIKSGSFAMCSDLTGVIVPEGVKSISGDTYNGAFYWCKNLKRMELPDSLTQIGDYAFYGCSSLEKLTIPYNVTSLGERAFGRCSSIEKIIIPKSVEFVGVGVFDYCDNLVSVSFEENTSLKSLSEMMFNYCGKLNSIKIPNGITTISSSAFRYCWALKNVTIPQSVVAIHNAVFEGCTSLENIYYEGTVESFCNIKLTPDLTDPTNAYDQGLCQNGANLFIGGDLVVDLIIPRTVSTINHNLFEGCVSLESVTFHNNLISIDSYAFRNCAKLENVVIPESVVALGDGVFEGCSRLTSITIPSSITEFKYSVFKDCTILTKVTYEGTLSEWCRISFEGSTSNPCNKGAKLYINGALVKSVTIPDSIDIVNKYTFFGCSSIRDVIIPEHVKTISSDAFSWCSNLEKITITSEKTWISSWSFMACDSLTDIIVLSSTPPDLMPNAFYGCEKIRRVRVPAETKNVFIMDSGWSDLANQIAEEIK